MDVIFKKDVPFGKQILAIYKHVLKRNLNNMTKL